MNFVINIVKGCILGTTAIIPGISIGSMAIVLNVYKKAIEGFSIVCVPKKWTKNNIIEYSTFFLPLLIGLIIAMFVLANVFSFLLANYPSFLFAGFFGIIVGSLPYIYKSHIKTHISWATSVYVLAGLAIIFFFAFADEIFSIQATASDIQLVVSMQSIIIAFLMGSISSACGLIPGISGSFVLLILGYYAYYLTIIKTLHIILLVPLVLGHLAGFIAVSIGIKYLLSHFATQSYSVIFGLIIGSAIAILPYRFPQEIIHLESPAKIAGNIFVLLLCLFGGILLARLGTLNSGDEEEIDRRGERRDTLA